MKNNNEDEGIGIALLYKNITLSTLFLERLEISVSICERHIQGGKTYGGLEGLGNSYIVL